MRKAQGIIFAVLVALVPLAGGGEGSAERTAQAAIGTTGKGVTFERGYPTPGSAKEAYDDLDLNRAIEAYRFFFPTVSGIAIFKGFENVGVVPNRVFGTL